MNEAGDFPEAHPFEKEVIFDHIHPCVKSLVDEIIGRQKAKPKAANA